MADNFTANAGSGGSVFAADDLGSWLLPRVKIQVGADGVGQDNWTPWAAVSAANTNGTNIKGSAGAIGFIYAVNMTATVKYLKLYNYATTPSPGTTTQFCALPIPASGTTGAGFMLPIPNGMYFSIGIGIGITTGYLTGDTGATSVGDVFLLIGYA